MDIFLKNFFSIKGRINRRTFFYYAVFFKILLFVECSLVEYLSSNHEEAIMLRMLMLLFFVITIVLYLCIFIKRLHDINLSGYWNFLVFFQFITYIMFSIKESYNIGISGWWVLISLTPLIHIAAFIFLMFKKGTKGPNKYGPDPLDKTKESEILNGIAIKD